MVLYSICSLCKDFSVRNSSWWMTMVYATLAVSHVWWFSTSLRLNLLRTGLMWQGMTNLGNCRKARKPQQDGQAKKDHCIKPNPNSVHSHGTKGAKRREETTVKERCDDKSDECKQQFKRVIFCSGSQGLRWSAVVKSLSYIYGSTNLRWLPRGKRPGLVFGLCGRPIRLEFNPTSSDFLLQLV